MKKNHPLPLLAATFLLLCLSSCENKKVYSPVTAFTYCDDAYMSIHTEDKLSFARCFMDFVQYPDDWTKLGLKGKVKTIHSDEKGLVTGLEFDEFGHVIMQGRVLGGRYGDALEFEYQDGRLQKAINRRARSLQTFLYNEANQLTTSKSEQYEKQYTYYENGMLKNVSIVKTNDRDGILNMDCDETGRVLALRMWATHPIVSTLVETDFTYEYNSDGLCNVKHGKAFIEERGIHIGKDYYYITDSLFTTSRYTYNDKHDIVKWEEEYSTSKKEISGSFTVEFSYEYDEQGNWTSRIATPSSEDVLKLLYQKNSFVMENGKPASKLERNIEYYSEEDIKMAQELAERKTQNKEEAMTARSLFQLSGAVKNVTITQTSGEGNTMADMDCFRTGTIKATFDEKGMLEAISCSIGPVDYRFTSKDGKYICDAKETTWQYPSYFRYDIQGNEFRILACLDTKDGNKGDSEVEVFKMEYDDENGRIISTSDMLAGELMGYAGGNQLNSTFHYKGFSRTPSSISVSMPFGGDEFFFEFQPVYGDVDEHGNWQSAQFINEGKVMYEQKREITYY